MSPDGLVIRPSSFSVEETAKRLEAAILAKGMTVMARIDHSAAAAAVGLALRPTLVILFGNPRAGTPLMQASPTLAIDLPLKCLVWRDDDGGARLAFDDPTWLAERHGLRGEGEATVRAMLQGLQDLARQATGAAPAAAP
ncbi:DUF302 domain-containing protein [Salinarimonas soli]|uniref:DUF302 domain-containing protein n=1 Tax=Salinarimonas soli TaxID=1638099 RepID=A0A5B2VC61_9HYPH|nr:DUF302 domain-containing protein [Salinarimonas soli]KAA2236574.1 DUF302 domain-containing protein [Salinarimonas soli]